LLFFLSDTVICDRLSNRLWLKFAYARPGSYRECVVYGKFMLVIVDVKKE
jgi:hypothetical protein